MSRLAQKPVQRSKTANKPANKASPRPEEQKAARKPAFMQAKLAVSQPGDTQEREADQVAAAVSRAPRAGVQRASLEPAITPEKKDESLAPKQAEQPAEQPVAAATRIARMAAGEAESVQTRLQRDAASEAETLQTRLYRQAETAEQPASDADQSLDETTEARIAAQQGQGDSMQESVRQDMQAQFGRDLTHVHIHTDAEAAELCAQVGARAFTVGGDIFFAPGEYAPETEAGRELLAHEMTHVVQQAGGAQRKVMRLETPPAAPVQGNCGSAGASQITYTVDPTSSSIRFNQVEVPPYKATFMQGRELRHARGQRSIDAMHNEHYNDLWRQGVGSASVGPVAAYINQRLDQHFHGGPRPPIYAFKARNGFRRGGERNPQFRHYIGTAEDVARELAFPTWSKNGELTSFEVDHKWELQLGGPNELSNFWLLNATTNGRSGTAIWNKLRNVNAKGVSENEKAKPQEQRLPGTASSDQVLANYDIRIDQPAPDARFTPQDDPLPPRYFWTQEEISGGQHVTSVSNLDSLLEVDDLSKIGGDGQVKVFPGQGGGVGKFFSTQPRISPSERDWMKPWVITGKEFFTSDPNAELLGNFRVQLPASQATQAIDQDTIAIRRYAGAGYAGYMEVGSDFLRLFGNLQVRGLSPIRVDSVAMGEAGLNLRGQVLPTLPLLSGTTLDLEVAEGEFRIFKAFNVEDFQIPAPFSLDRASLSIGAGSTRGLYAEGRLDFSVRQLGTGYLEAVAGTANGFALGGGFDFDSDLFDRAHIEMWYRNEQFGAAGEIGIDQPDKIRGIRAANITARYEAGQFAATGTVQPSIPGVQEAGLNVAYSEAEGLTIGGNLQLAANPAIRSGSIDVTINKRDDIWRVAASGTAQPAIPGIDSELRVNYDDGAFTAEFNGAFERGMLAGSVDVGVTNRAVGEDGRPSGEAQPGAPLIVYGGGSATVRIAPWLQGTAGVRFAPDGEVTVAGEIGLPGQIEIFPRKQIDKNIFSIDIPIPIVPGIFAEVGGSLGARAGIGPGVIDQLRLGIEYNPAHEENTHVTGDGHVNVPADAGLRLAVHGGIGLGIPAASVSGGLEVGGELGIAGAAEAGVHIDWMPSQGLQIDAFGRLSAHPKFLFDVSGYVEVEALFFTIYEDRWQLASFEYGSDMTFGVNFPIRYREGEPFDISLDDVEFQTPDISVSDILGGLVEQIV